MIDIVKLIEVHAEEESKLLIPSGERYKCTCFFHDENEPSFVVYPHTNTWWCFGCNSGSTPEDFIMKHYGPSLGPGVIAGWKASESDEVDEITSILEEQSVDSCIDIATRIAILVRRLLPEKRNKYNKEVDSLLDKEDREALLTLEQILVDQYLS